MDLPTDISLLALGLPEDTEAVLTDAELRELAERVRGNADPLLRRLLLGYLTIRRVTADVVDGIATRDGGQVIASSALFRRARILSAPVK